MRLRFKPYAAPELDAWTQCERAPRDWRGRWAQHFARPQQPLYLELGCGKGGFLAQHSTENPHINYIGIDMTDKVLVLAKRKLEQAFADVHRAPDNVCIVPHDIERIREMLCADDAVQRVYINFCNPWNKNAGHTKHRLTYPRQLLQYADFLTPDAEIWFKCDDDNLYTDTLAYLPQAGFAVTWQTWDLHADEPAWNRRTEHEEMYAAQGMLTHALIARQCTPQAAMQIEKAEEGKR